MAEYINRTAIYETVCKGCTRHGDASGICYADELCEELHNAFVNAPAADVVKVKHGRWVLEAHNERVNYRWNVTAECSECCDEKKEIWAGFFPGVPDSMAREAALISAESVKLSNYCPNCGADMREKSEG